MIVEMDSIEELLTEQLHMLVPVVESQFSKESFC